MELSRESLNKAKKQLQDFVDSYKKGISNSIKIATEAMYNKVIEYCIANGIFNHTDAVHWEYNEEKNIGRVWTNDWTLIFNEMGTGIVGSNNPHPSPSDPFKDWKYDVNKHGEKGWWYPSNSPHAVVGKDGVSRAWTKGLPSRHMFYSAFQDIKNEIGEYVNVELQKTVGNMYKE